MTTIATDGKTMAGDTLTTGAGQVVAYQQKVHRTKDGRIYGCAGERTDAALFGRWMDDPDIDPELSDDFEALILNPDGTGDWIGKKLEPSRYLVPMTIGSGEGIALGAMLAGASPEKAVALAALRDIKTGGDITALSIEKPVRAVA